MILIEKYRSGLIYYANLYVDNDQVAEDIVSDVFIKAIKYNLQDEKNWLYHAVKNACKDYIKKGKTRYKQIGFEVFKSRFQEYEESIENKIIHNEVMQMIHDQIEKLPLQAKRVFKMAYLDEIPTKDIAKKLGILPKDVINNKSRALALLKLKILK